MALRLLLTALCFAILAAVVFYVDGYVLATLVAMFAGASGLAAMGAFAVLGYRVARGRRRIWSLVLVAGLVALEAGMVGGLNSYADVKAATGITLLQDYSAEVKAAELLGDSVASRRAPIGVTYATVEKQAGSVSDHYYRLELPSELLDYAAAVAGWASSVQGAAFEAEAGKPWVAPAAPPFHLTMTADQANSAFNASQREIATIVQFGNLALKDKNVAGIRYVGARLFAQHYWLTGVATSLDNTSTTARLHFIEPFVVTHPMITETGPWTASRTVPTCQGGLCVQQILSQLEGISNAADNVAAACSGATNSFNATAACSASQDNLGLMPDWAASVTGLSAPSGVAPTNVLHVAKLRFALTKGWIVSLIPPTGPWSRVENLTVNPGEAAGATTLRVNTFKPRENWPICTPVVFNFVTYFNQRTPGWREALIGSCESDQPVPVPSLLQSFTATCTASGSTVLVTPGVPPGLDRMPTTEGGWTCTKPSTECIALLTYSGSEYQGGPAGCTQAGLGPEVTVNSPTYNPAQPETPSAAPVPRCPAGYSYSAADNLCHSRASVPHCPAGYPYYNAADNKCYQRPPPGPGQTTNWYLHWSCGTSDQCAEVMGGKTGMVQRPFSSQASCLNAQATWANNRTMQPYSGEAGDWCSTSNKPTDAHP